MRRRRKHGRAAEGNQRGQVPDGIAIGQNFSFKQKTQLKILGRDVFFLSMKVWKKNAVLAIVILFVCVAVYLNWSYGRGEAQEDESRVNAGTNQEAALDGTQQVDAGDTAESGDKLVSLEGDPQISETAAEADYFATARLNRQQSRDSSLEILKKSTDNDKLSQEKRDEAAKSLSTIADYAMSEAKIENLVIAKGYKDCVAFIDDGGINVVVAAAKTGLQAEDVSKIKDIVVDETGISVDKIKIIEAAQ
jgi:stage III sporulation protein AH